MTDPTPRYGRTRARKLKAAEDELRRAIRAEGTPRIQTAWDRMEPWVQAWWQRDTAQEREEV